MTEHLHEHILIHLLGVLCYSNEPHHLREDFAAVVIYQLLLCFGTLSQAGTYVWGSTIYAMGADGAARLAEVYEKTGIKHVVLLVKGESGTIGYFKNSLSNAPKSRTDRDMLAETVSAMHAKGIKVYAWLVVGVDEAKNQNHRRGTWASAS